MVASHVNSWLWDKSCNVSRNSRGLNKRILVPSVYGRLSLYRVTSSIEAKSIFYDRRSCYIPCYFFQFFPLIGCAIYPGMK